jgi:hypothetical protein
MSIAWLLSLILILSPEGRGVKCGEYFLTDLMLREVGKMIGKKTLFVLLGITLTIAVTGCTGIYKITLQGSWEVDEHYTNGVEDTQAFHLLCGDYIIKFHPDGDFIETYKAMNLVPINNPGTWDIINNGAQLQLVYENETKKFDIRSITNDELILYRELKEGGNEELVLEPKEEL